MNKIWNLWKSGWGIILKWIWFSFAVMILCIPVHLTQYFLDASNTAVFQNGSFNIRGGVVFAVYLINLPIAMAIVNNITGWFNGED